MKAWAGLAALVLGLFALVGGCNATVLDGGDPSPEAVCNALANAYCDRSFALACPSSKLSFPSRLACIERETEVCVQSLDLPGVTFDGSAELECADAISGFDCTELDEPTAACPLRTGTRVPGESCVEGPQCTTGFCSGDVSVCGKCMSIASEGQPCVNSYDASMGGTLCDMGLVCAGSPLRCVKLGVPGAACSAIEPCGAFFSCVDGVCGTVGEGAPCDPYESACDPAQHLGCDPDSKTCKKYPPPKLVGCEKDGCPPDEYCEEDPPKAVCKKETPEGGSCDGAHFICAGPSWCDHGLCTSVPIACE